MEFMNNLAESNKILGLLVKGGIVIIPIVMLSMLAVYLFFERLFFLRKANILMSEDKMLIIQNKIEKDDLDSIEQIFNISDESFKNVLLAGVREYKRKSSTTSEIENAVAFALNQEFQKMDRGMDTLANIYNLAPMLGFLGTVTGMITAFMEMAKANDMISTKTIAGGIYEALITTVVGLVVSVATSLMYILLSSKIKNLENTMEIYANSFISFLKKQK